MHHNPTRSVQKKPHPFLSVKSNGFSVRLLVMFIFMMSWDTFCDVGMPLSCQTNGSCFCCRCRVCGSLCHVYLCTSTTWGLGYISQYVYELAIEIIHKNIFVLIKFWMIQSGKNFGHVLTAPLSGHGQNFYLIVPLFYQVKTNFIFTRFGLWAHK